MRDEILKGLKNLRTNKSELYRLGSHGIKSFINQVIKLFDDVASFIIRERTTVERDYLTLSRSHILNDSKSESDFYNIYFYFKNLLRKDVKRLDKDKVFIRGHKNSEVVTNDYFENLLDRVNEIAEKIISF